MKKKIAVYANGWNRDALFSAMEGIKKYSEKEDFDVFVFVSHAYYGEKKGANWGELNVYVLADIREFDGLILFSSMLNSVETVQTVCRNAKENHIPVVSIGLDVEGVPFVGVDNEVGMREVVTHLVEDCGVKRVVFIGGTVDHPDSVERLNVTRKVLQEHGLELREDDLYYANWEYGTTLDVIDHLLESEEGLPDAIVCANDYMALAAGSQLIFRGCEIPKDVRLTGFDHVHEGEIFYPALTTVEQNYEEIGYRCCEIIYDQIRQAQEKKDDEESGAPELPHLRVPSKMVHAESCGCLDNPYYDKVRKDYCGLSYMNNNWLGMIEQKERVLQLYVISPSNNYEALRRNLVRYYENDHDFVGNNFCIVLRSQYVTNPMIKESEIRVQGYDEELEAVVCLKDGKNQEHQKVMRKMLVPGYQKEEGVQKIYYIFPMHMEEFNYGYIVFGEDADIVRSSKLHSYVEKLQENLKSFRINLRLDYANCELKEIYDKDAMTGLFNRFGYENKALPLFSYCKENKSVMMVMFVDINYMKKINDVYGHLHGDNAIKIVTEAIKANLQEEWIAVRFGGDEFLVLASDCDRGMAENIKQGILDYLERKNCDGTRPYRISVSCGYVLTNPNKDTDLQGYIREADAMMYEIKRQVHAKDAK